MASVREKPDYLPYLTLKGIHPGECFCFEGEPRRFYRLTRGCRLLDLADEPAVLTENDVWERLDELRAVSMEEFDRERARRRDRLWARRGKMTSAALEPAARAFAENYALRYEAGQWKEIGRHDEETMRRILCRALDLLLEGGKIPQKERRERLAGMFYDAVQARGEILGQQAGDVWNKK